MKTIRKIKTVQAGVPTLEGAGVRLKRMFGFEKVPGLDPFLLLDDFGSKDPGDYIAGFPWHPHRGIKTITYVLKGEIDHGDSMGNQGVIGPGDVQWMTAGSGVIHQEMPRENRRTGLQGFFDPGKKKAAGAGKLVTFGDGDGVEIRAGKAGARFLLVSGKPLRKPVAWRGPIVMNTEEELRTAFAEYEAGTFLKHKAVMG
ncbi:MAG: pirin family protein [Candidatus Aminicenantes bacterium]|nr:pirin family protein [Candidatus Aminicenantes bacterium]